mgnify:CR=1 FL=1
MKKLLILLLLPVFTQANAVDKLYDSVKDELTHIVCKASGETVAKLGSASDSKAARKTDYFSFKDDGDSSYLFLRLQDGGYINTLVFLPSQEKGKRFQFGNDSYDVLSFNDESLVFYFEASRDQLKGMYQNGEEYRHLSMEWRINRMSGDYKTIVEEDIYIAKFKKIHNTKANLEGSCEAYDPNKKKF